MGCVHGVQIRFLSSIMQWVKHITENLKCTIKRERVCVCVLRPQEKMANFLLSSFKTCYFIWKEKKPVFNSEILWLCFTMLLMLWIFSTHIQHILHHFFLLLLFVCLSFFLSQLFMARECFTTHIHSLLACSFLTSCVQCCLWYFCSFSHFWFGIECVCLDFSAAFFCRSFHFISFLFINSYSASFFFPHSTRLSSCVVIIQQSIVGALVVRFFLLTNVKYIVGSLLR